MRQVAAAVLEVPTAGFRLAARFVGHSFKTQLVIVFVAVMVVVSGLLVGLPTSGTEAKAPTPYDPAVPSAVPSDPLVQLAVGDPYVIEFTNPMNESSVANALTITPQASVKLVWDSSSQVLSIMPTPYWTAFTTYAVSVAASALDQSGMQLGTAITGRFKTGALTSGTITATLSADGLVAPTSAFQITFTSPVKLATVQARLAITPAVTGTITGDDPTDASSQVFTFTPDDPLAGGTSYTVSFDATNATDADGVALLPVAPLQVQTMAAPAVIKFRPVDGGYTTDPNQVISVRFSMPMNRSTTASALSVIVNGNRVRGAITWAENNTVLVLDPTSRLPVGKTVYIRISATASAATGQRLSKAVSASFTVRKATVRTIRWSGGVASTSAPYHDAELYYLQLMNCTRTGGWVTGGGTCSSVTHHVLPAQDPLAFSAAIANAVARPYSKLQADRGVLSHYLVGTPHSRMASAGFPSGSWGENLASPPSASASGMINAELYFQNEYRCSRGQCEFAHYFNIMDPYFHQAGIGVWVSGRHVVLTVDFYG